MSRSRLMRQPVDRPPADAESAWQVSLEQTLAAPDTIVLPGVTRAQHARTLLGRGKVADLCALALSTGAEGANAAGTTHDEDPGSASES